MSQQTLETFDFVPGSFSKPFYVKFPNGKQSTPFGPLNTHFFNGLYVMMFFLMARQCETITLGSFVVLVTMCVVSVAFKIQYLID